MTRFQPVPQLKFNFQNPAPVSFGAPVFSRDVPTLGPPDACCMSIRSRFGERCFQSQQSREGRLAQCKGRGHKLPVRMKPLLVYYKSYKSAVTGLNQYAPLNASGWGPRNAKPSSTTHPRKAATYRRRGLNWSQVRCNFSCR